MGHSGYGRRRSGMPSRGGRGGRWRMRVAAKYVDKAGRLAVMGEFIFRGFNVAEAAFDVCKDLVVFDDRTSAMYRVHVQSEVARVTKAGAKVRFLIPEWLYRWQRVPQRRFIFAFRVREDWRYMIFTDEELRALVTKHKADTIQDDKRHGKVFVLEVVIPTGGTPEVPGVPDFDIGYYFARWNLWSRPGEDNLVP